MKQRKHLTQVSIQNWIRRQNKSALNSRYIISHMFTSPLPHNNTSLDQFSSITIAQCLQELDSHLLERRTIQPIYAQQIKSYLNELSSKGARLNQNIHSNKINRKESLHRINTTVKSPYNISLKKLRGINVQNQKPEFKLKKKKMNFQNIEPKKQNNLGSQIQLRDKLMAAKVAQLKGQCIQMCKDMHNLKDQLMVNIGAFKVFVQNQIQQIGAKAISQIHTTLTFKQLQVKQAEQALTHQFQNKVGFIKKQSQILRDYVKQRQGEILILWQTVNGYSL